jgi:hypothetical protein
LFLALSAVAVLGIGLAPSANAASLISFNPNGTGAGDGTINGIASFVWGPGDALAVGSIPLTVGKNFTLLYETTLSGYQGATGPIAAPGLGTTYQITEVATLPETVVAITQQANGNVTATFQPTAGQTGTVQIYDQNPITTPANFITGAGFTAGTLIYSANVTTANQSQLPNSTFTDTTATSPGGNTVALDQSAAPNPANAAIKTEQGSGSATIGMSTATILSPAYFVTPGIVSSVFSSNLTVPFTNVVTATTMYNGAAVNAGTIGTINGLNGTSFLFQVSAGSQSFSVPEPASIGMALTALGIVPLVSWQVRRRRTQA